MIRTLNRRRTCFALPLLLLAGTLRDLAAQQTDTPRASSKPAAAATAITASLHGSITDIDGAAIPDARGTVTQPLNAPTSVSTTTDGQFIFTNLAAGAYTLSVSAAGFSRTQIIGDLEPGKITELPAIALTAAATTNVNISASQADIAQAQVNFEEKQRVLSIVPNFYVSYISNPEPLNQKQKYRLALLTLVDPVSFALNGAVAGVQQAQGLFAWQEGARGYGKRYAAAYGTFLTGTLLGNAALPALFRQDPRYFYKNGGSIRSRLLYALAMSVVCKGDNDHWQANYSGVLGSVMASGISNVYYPAADRNGPRLIVEGTAIGIAIGGAQNVLQQFLVRRLTPHTHPTAPNR